MGRMLWTLFKLVVSIIWLPLLIWFFKDQIVAWTHQHPALAAMYDYSSVEIANKTMFGAAILQFFSNLIFILFLPKYLVFGYFVKSGVESPAILIMFSALGMFLAMCVNYLLGFCFGFIARLLLKGNMEKLDSLLLRFGSPLILVGYLFPLGFPCTLLSFICGSSHFSIRKFMLCTLVGSLTYFTILTFCQKWLMSVYEKANFIL